MNIEAFHILLSRQSCREPIDEIDVDNFVVIFENVLYQKIIPAL